MTEKTTRKNCQACKFMLHGVKTRRAIPHTCERTVEEIKKFIEDGIKRIKRNKRIIKTGE